MNDNTEPVIYDACKDANGWTVFNMTTGETARVNDVPQSGLSIEAAYDLCDLFDALERQKVRPTACAIIASFSRNWWSSR